MMTNTEFAKKIFERIETSEKQDDLKNILLEDSTLAKYKMNEGKYPKLEFSISESDLINVNMDTINWNEQTALTKLLYAIVWKNGDLGKEKHIIKGIKNTNDTERIVFYQLGKHLSNSNEPIYDQHVLRAFQFYESNGNVDFKVIGDSVTKKEHGEIATKYIKWLNEELPENVRNIKDYRFYIDKILFALGKKIKKTSN